MDRLQIIEKMCQMEKKVMTNSVEFADAILEIIEAPEEDLLSLELMLSIEVFWASVMLEHRIHN